MPSRRRRPAGEGGYSLLELMVATAILGIVLAIILSVLASVQRGYSRQSDRSQTNDQARLAVEELDREIRSGNLFYDPASENDPTHQIYPGMALRIYTQSNAPTNPGYRCVQWRINDDELQTRHWATNWHDDPSSLVSDWRIAATHILNRSLNPQVGAFVLDTSQLAFGSRILKITLVANQNPGSGSNETIMVSLTGRNTEYGYPSNVCSDIPPY